MELFLNLLHRTFRFLFSFVQLKPCLYFRNSHGSTPWTCLLRALLSKPTRLLCLTCSPLYNSVKRQKATLSNCSPNHEKAAMRGSSLPNNLSNISYTVYVKHSSREKFVNKWISSHVNWLGCGSFWRHMWKSFLVHFLNPNQIIKLKPVNLKLWLVTLEQNILIW